MKPHLPLLTREQFKERVFQRDAFRCIFCENAAEDAHHILEQKLWEDGGYYLDNGASVCNIHHLLCEQTLITPEEIRRACGIPSVHLPNGFDTHYSYDKWGNPVLPNGTRYRGELYFEEPVQKIILECRLDGLFIPQSLPPRVGSFSLKTPVDSALWVDQNILLLALKNEQLTTLYSDSSSNAAFSSIQSLIPPSWRVEGYRHTAYPQPFVGLRIWDDTNHCLAWETTLEWFALLNITAVPVLYQGIFEPDVLSALPHTHQYLLQRSTGFSFKDSRFSLAVFQPD